MDKSPYRLEALLIQQELIKNKPIYFDRVVFRKDEAMLNEKLLLFLIGVVL